jgi:hypothetical protein
MTNDTYNLWSLILQATIGFFIVGTFAVYYFQLRAMRHGSTAQNILALVNFLQVSHVRDARTHVRKVLDGKPYSKWTDDDKRQAEAVCANYDIASIIALKHKLAPPSLLLDDFGPSIRACYEILKPHIEEFRKAENSGPTYWDDFGELYAQVSRSQRQRKSVEAANVPRGAS